jgi:Sulfotransferase domain
LPIFRSDEADDRTRDANTARQDAPERVNRVKSIRQELRHIRQELRKVKNEALTAKAWAERTEHNKKKKKMQQEIFRLERELRMAEEGGAEDAPVTGALPDFVIIGAQKCGTTFLYHLLAQHALVEPAAKKELHFFDKNFDLGVEWYRQCFAAPRWEDGRRTITGEATPYYMFHPLAAERMAEIVPEARLIALIRDPVDRAYSHHQQEARKGDEPLSFEEAIEAEEGRLRGEGNRMLEDKKYASFEHQRLSYLSRGVYVDQLLRWSELFSRGQLLVLKSEDFFEHPLEILESVLAFLGLPEWAPAPSQLGYRRHEGRYERDMDPTIRRRLERYFEPHNRRLYDFLGVNLGW